MDLSSLEHFIFTPDQLQELNTKFSQIAANVRLEKVDPAVRASIPKESGCYFWTLRISDRQYRIYIGRTRSMRKRFTDYRNDIQIHSPNDYKLRFFQELIHEQNDSAAFDLYFAPVPEAEYKRREIDLLTTFDPLINKLRRPTSDDRMRILEGFRAYYTAAIADRCNDDA